MGFKVKEYAEVSTESENEMGRCGRCDTRSKWEIRA